MFKQELYVYNPNNKGLGVTLWYTLVSKAMFLRLILKDPI